MKSNSKQISGQMLFVIEFIRCNIKFILHSRAWIIETDLNSPTRLITESFCMSSVNLTKQILGKGLSGDIEHNLNGKFHYCLSHTSRLTHYLQVITFERPSENRKNDENTQMDQK